MSDSAVSVSDNINSHCDDSQRMWSVQVKPLTDWQLIFILIVISAPAFFLDREVDQRWCDTYQFCEEQTGVNQVKL